MTAKQLILTGAIGAFFIGCVSSAFSATRFDHLVRNKFFAGFAGDKAAFDEGMKICEQILAENPQHAEAMVWYGGGLFSRAGEAFRNRDNENGKRLYARALGYMDRAVALAPDSVAVRVPRGSVLLTATRTMPTEIAGPLRQKGLSDFEHVLKLQSDHFDKLGEHPRGELLSGLADGWSRAGDKTKATMYFERIEKEMPDTVYAKRARKWLQNGSLTASEAGCLGCHVSR